MTNLIDNLITKLDQQDACIQEYHWWHSLRLAKKEKMITYGTMQQSHHSLSK